MKQYVVLILLILPFFLRAQIVQDERWDEKAYIYSNYKYGFHWKLLPDIKWNKENGIEKHTVFRASSDKDVITCFVNAVSSDKEYKYELWYFYDILKKKMMQSDDVIYKNTGERIIDRVIEKCMFCNQKSIKTSYTSIIQDDRYDEPFKVKSICYIYMYNNCTYTVSVKMHLYFYNEIKSSVKDFFKGYGMSVISSN